MKNTVKKLMALLVAVIMLLALFPLVDILLMEIPD